MKNIVVVYIRYRPWGTDLPKTEYTQVGCAWLRVVNIRGNDLCDALDEAHKFCTDSDSVCNTHYASPR